MNKIKSYFYISKQKPTVRLFSAILLLCFSLNSCSVWEKFFPSQQNDGYNDPFANTRQPRQAEEEELEAKNELEAKKQNVKEMKSALAMVSQAIGLAAGQLGNIEAEITKKIPGRGYVNSDTGVNKLIGSWMDKRDEIEELIDARLEAQGNLAEAEMEFNTQHYEDYFSDRETVRNQLITQEKDEYQGKLEEHQRQKENSLKKLEGRKTGLRRLLPENYVDLLD